MSDNISKEYTTESLRTFFSESDFVTPENLRTTHRVAKSFYGIVESWEEMDIKGLLKELCKFLDFTLHENREYGRIQFDEGKIIAMNFASTEKKLGKGTDGKLLGVTEAGKGSVGRGIYGNSWVIVANATLEDGTRAFQETFEFRQPMLSRWSEDDIYKHDKHFFLVKEMFLEDCYNFVNFLRHRTRRFECKEWS